MEREFTHELIEDEEYYINGPQQQRPPDGTFKKGTKIILLHDIGSYSQVTSISDIIAYVTTVSLRPLENKSAD